MASFPSRMQKNLTWVFLFVWPLLAMFILLWVHMAGLGHITGGWGLIPLIVFATIFGVYYPGLVIYASAALSLRAHPHIEKPKTGMIVRLLFIVPAVAVAAYVLAIYIGKLGSGNFLTTLFSEDLFLAVAFLYYPLLTLFVIFRTLYYAYVSIYKSYARELAAHTRAISNS